jgi:hypothetical protein
MELANSQERNDLLEFQILELQEFSAGRVSLISHLKILHPTSVSAANGKKVQGRWSSGPECPRWVEPAGPTLLNLPDRTASLWTN